MRALGATRWVTAAVGVGAVMLGFGGCGPKPTLEGIAKGKVIYRRSCVVCHGVEGLGVNASVRSLVGAELVTGPVRPLIAILLDGLRGPIGGGVMPAWRDSLDDEEIAAVAGYVRSEWGGFGASGGAEVSSEEVAALRAETKVRQRFWTLQELRALGE